MSHSVCLVVVYISFNTFVSGVLAMKTLHRLAAFGFATVAVALPVAIDPPVVMKIGEDNTITDPLEAREHAAKHTFGPKQIAVQREARTDARVPVKVILAEKGEVLVEFEEREVTLPLTKEQLPEKVAVVSRFKDGIEKPGAFLRNPTDEYLLDPYTTRVVGVSFWQGLGYYVCTNGGRQWRCGSGGITLDGKLFEAAPPEPKIAPGYAATDPMPDTAEVPIDYRLNSLEVATLTPIFSWSVLGENTKEYYIWLNDAPVGQTCSADSLPLESRRCVVPEGALKPAHTYQLGIVAMTATGTAGYRMVQFRTPDPEKVVAGEVEYEIQRSNIDAPW